MTVIHKARPVQASKGSLHAEQWRQVAACMVLLPRCFLLFLHLPVLLHGPGKLLQFRLQQHSHAHVNPCLCCSMVQSKSSNIITMSTHPKLTWTFEVRCHLHHFCLRMLEYILLLLMHSCQSPVRLICVSADGLWSEIALHCVYNREEPKIFLCAFCSWLSP